MNGTHQAKQTLEQRRAADAMRQAKALEGQKDELKKNYRAYVDRLGPAILVNGLGQALASERAAAGGEPTKPEHAHQLLYNAVQAWLCREEGVYSREPDLLQAIISQSQSRYLKAQVEALEWLSWHKKFCRAYLPRGEHEES